MKIKKKKFNQKISFKKEMIKFNYLHWKIFNQKIKFNK